MSAKFSNLKGWLQEMWRKRRARCIAVALFSAYIIYQFLIPRHEAINVTEQDVTESKISAGWQPEQVPNPKTWDARNWVCNPDGILSNTAVNEINSTLQELENSLSIEIAVVALNSIQSSSPRDFAHRLFNLWGVGKVADNNGLLILLTLDQRDITFETGYGLEGVLTDKICKRIQTTVMVPYLHENDWDKGMIEGVKAITATLYGSDYQAAPPESWLSKFWRTTPALFFVILGILLLLTNWLTWKCVIMRLRPKDESIQTSLAFIATHKPLNLRTLIGTVWLVPVWPAMIAMTIWYLCIQRTKIQKRCRTCPKCQKETLKQMPTPEMMKSQELADHERMELKLKTAYIRIYTCTDCGKSVKLRIQLNKGYERCPACHSMTLHKEEKYKSIIQATTVSEDLREARHKCFFCGAEYMVSYKIPRISSSSGRGSGGSGGSSGGGSFGGGSSGGGGASSRF